MIKNTLRSWFSSFPKFDVLVNYYKILNVTEKATQSEIKQQYYKLAKIYHPDVNTTDETKFKQINEAYQVLIQHKEEYDQARNNFGGFKQQDEYQYQQQQQSYQYYKQRDKNFYERMKQRAFEDEKMFQEDQLRKKQAYMKQKIEEERRFQEQLKQRQAQYQQQIKQSQAYQQYQQYANQKSSNYTFGQDWRVYEKQAQEYVEKKMNQKQQDEIKQEQMKNEREFRINNLGKQKPVYKQTNIFEEYMKRNK